MARLMEAPGTQAFVCRDDGVAGLILLRTVADEAEILTIAVEAESRRRGAGRRLLDVATQAARAAGAAKLHLEVAATNDAARALYSGAGFIETGRRARYYADGADALLLSKTLV